MNSISFGRPGKILVVDDEEGIVDLLSELLSDIGYDTRKARDGDEALDVIRSFKPDIIVSDVEMQRIDGNEFFRRVVKEAPAYAKKFVFMTGSDPRETVLLPLQQAGCEILCKPFDPVALFAVIEKKVRTVNQVGRK